METSAGWIDRKSGSHWRARQARPNMVASGLWGRYHEAAGRRGTRQYQALRDPSRTRSRYNDAAFTEENFRATPLWYAIAFGKNLELARFLLKRGSDTIACLPLLTTTMLLPSAFLRRTAPISILKRKGPLRSFLPCSGAASKPPRNF